MSAIIGRSLYKPFVISLALAFLYATVLLKLGRDWWHAENYSHGLLIAFIIGYIVSSQPKRLEVVEACSGIRSLMTLITLAVVFAYFTYPRSDNSGSGPGSSGGNQAPARFKSFGLWRSIIIVMAAIPIAILTNVLR